MIYIFTVHCTDNRGSTVKKSKVCVRAKWPIRPALFYSPLDGMLVHRRVTPSIKFAGTHLYTWVERGPVRVKCVVQEHNAMTLARVRTRAARPGDERTNHEATAAPTRLHAAPHEVRLYLILIYVLLVSFCSL